MTLLDLLVTITLKPETPNPRYLQNHTVLSLPKISRLNTLSITKHITHNHLQNHTVLSLPKKQQTKHTYHPIHRKSARSEVAQIGGRRDRKSPRQEVTQIGSLPDKCRKFNPYCHFLNTSSSKTPLFKDDFRYSSHSSPQDLPFVKHPPHTPNPALVSPNHKKSRKGISLQDHLNLCQDLIADEVTLVPVVRNIAAKLIHQEGEYKKG